MKQLRSVISVFVVWLFVGCVEQLAAPDPSGSTVEISPSNAVTADISGGTVLVLLRLNPTEFPDPTCTHYTLRVAGILNGTKASGSASLRIEGDPSRHFHYNFAEGSVSCDGGLPVVEFSGEGHTTDNSGGARGGTYSKTLTFTLSTTTPPPPAEPVPVQLRMLDGEPEELVGEPIDLNFPQA
jgi:hypothetical protein